MGNGDCNEKIRKCKVSDREYNRNTADILPNWRYIHSTADMNELGEINFRKEEEFKMGYCFTKVLEVSFENAIIKVTEELKKEGFGILTKIDVKETLKDKLDADFKEYIILGACNPQFAFRALQLEDKIGLMLPCNVIVENNNGRVEVSAIDPIASMQAVRNQSLTEIANEVREKLKIVIKNL